MLNNKTGSLDTNILLRLVLNDIPEQTVIIKGLFEQTDVFHLADIVIFEMVFILDKYYECSREDICKSIRTIIRHNQINCNRRLFELTLPLYLEHSKLSIVDCALTQYAVLNKSTPLYTFDKELAKQCSDVVIIPE